MERKPAQPFKSKVIKEQKSYRIDEEGNVIMTTSEVKDFYFTSREFTTMLRNIQENIQKQRHWLTEEGQKELKENLGKFEQQLKEITPFQKQAEDLTVQLHKAKLLKTKISTIKNHLASPQKEHNAALIANIMGRAKELGESAQILKELTDQERQLVTKYIALAKRAKK